MKTKLSSIHHIRVFTLGCAKNTVDSEFLIGLLIKNGFSVYSELSSEKSDAVIINTCGFINEAKEQSIDALLENLNMKEKGLVKKIYAVGCLAQRYKKELLKELPQLDGVYGLNELAELIKDLGGNKSFDLLGERQLLTPSHYAYLKISDGCDRKCSFCAIPNIKGNHTSRSIESLVDESLQLASKGVKEIILIAQDLTWYGKDIYRKKMIPQLISSLSAINGIQWIRLHYAYPSEVNDELIDTIKNNNKVCKYIDIPLQHISDRILQSMNRGLNKKQTYNLIEKIRKNIPGIALRTSFITGYPGETTKEFIELKNFIKEFRFERLGVFKYSHEEDTPAYCLSDNISSKSKDYRYNKLMQVQQEISYLLNKELVGRIIRVIVDDIKENAALCRSEYDSPEIDNMVIIRNAPAGLIPGQFVNVKITDAEIYDIFGEVYN